MAISAKSNAMVLFNPVFDNGPEGWGHQRVGKRHQEFSPLHNISPDDPPAIVFLGSADKLIPVETAQKFEMAMENAGNRCETHIYEGQPDGFFNHGRSVNRWPLVLRDAHRHGQVSGVTRLALGDTNAPEAKRVE